MQPDVSERQIEGAIKKLVSQGFDVHRSSGIEHTILGAVGARAVDTRDYELLDARSPSHY